jgi:zona occludens toxin (predicted ATPase)
MITFITGVPGSGKTYFAVTMIYDFILSHQKKNNLSFAEACKTAKILHNIDGMSLGTNINEHCAEKDISLDVIFSRDFHEKNDFFRGWFFVIDECQMLFPYNYKVKGVQEFFQMHRHFGIDVTLLSQGQKLVSPSIVLLAESQFKAVSDIANPLPGFFMYRRMVGWESVGRTFRRKKQKVFDLYKTADFDQKKVRKKSRPMMMLFFVGFLLILLVIYLMSTFRDGWGEQPNKNVSSVSGVTQGAIYQRNNDNHRLNSEILPDSYFDKLGGYVPVYASTIKADKEYILFLGVLWLEDGFPYEIIESPAGSMVMLPKDMYIYIKNKKNQNNEKIKTSTTNRESTHR